MKIIVKTIAFIAVLGLTLTGCEKSIIEDDPGVVDNRNVELRIFYTWGNRIFYKDSVYEKNGAKFKIDEINLLVTKFFYVNEKDTISETRDYALTTNNVLTNKVGLITVSSISGGYGITVGLDSIENATEPKDWSDGEVLANENIYSNKIGYHFITVKGRIFDPAKPNETEPSLALNWVVATNLLNSKFSVKRSFSIPIGKQVVLDSGFDLDKFSDDIFPLATPIIKSDPTDTDDFNAAMQLKNNFQDKAFHLK